MRTSVVTHPPRSRFVTLRPHYVEMCGHGAAAMLLAVFEGWTNWKLQQHEIDDTSDAWIALSIEQLRDDLGGAFGRTAVSSGVEILVERGFVERRASTTTDRRTLYRLSVARVQQAVDRHLHESANAIGRFVQMEAQESTNATRAHQTAVEKNKEKNTPMSPIDEVWAFYVQTFNAERQTLNETRKRVIRNALKVRSVDECKRAILGLKHSPHHNGENPERRTWLDIRYALRGNGQRGESHEERIDKMAALAPVTEVEGGTTETMPRKVKIEFNNLRSWAATRAPHSEMSPAAQTGYERLQAMGYDVAILDSHPWVRLSRRAGEE